MIKDYIKNPYRVFMLLGDHGLLDWLPDEPAVKLLYRANTGRKLDYDNARGYCEKLCWLKVYDQQPRYTQYSDKLAVRDYVAEKLGTEYIVPVLGVWDDPDDIDFDALPERFVLKATHDSGSVLVCRDKAEFDRAGARKFFKRALRNRFYMKGRERQYEGIVPRVLAEAYLDDGSGGLPTDYKFYCFGGVPRILYVAKDRVMGKTANIRFFDMEWNPVSIKVEGFGDILEPLPRPDNLDELVDMARKLSEGMPVSRIDLYDVNGHPYFGEITLCDGSGYEWRDPVEWEMQFGDWITLPEVKTMRHGKAARR